MKTLLKMSLLAVGLATAASSLVNAAEVAPAAAPAGKHPHRHAALAHRKMVRHHVAKQLGLSAEQTATLKADRAKTHDAVKAIRADASLTPEQKKAKLRDTVKSARTEMRSVLTPDQQTQLKQLRSRGRRQR